MMIGPIFSDTFRLSDWVFKSVEVLLFKLIVVSADRQILLIEISGLPVHRDSLWFIPVIFFLVGIWFVLIFDQDFMLDDLEHLFVLGLIHNQLVLSLHLLLDLHLLKLLHHILDCILDWWWWHHLLHFLLWLWGSLDCIL
jgi:hypothetical protein